MIDLTERVPVGTLPLPPKNPLSFRQRLKALRNFHTGLEALRDAGGPVSQFCPRFTRLIPAVVIVTSPQGGRDILSRTDASVDRTSLHAEMRHLLGDNLFDVPHREWVRRKRALQPVFTKQRVRAFARHMSQAAETVCAGWLDRAEIDLDTEARRLTLRALGRSVLDLDLDERADLIAEPLRVVLNYVADRSLRPFRAPRWLPTPARHRARAANSALHQIANDILQGCRADPTRDAPLVQALIATTDPETGQALSDDEICHELVIFMAAGHDTTATTLAYAFWALGRNPDIQQRVAAEAIAIGDRELTPEDIPQLGYTVQVLHEALRLCPPAAAIGRTTLQDVEVDGYRVPAGTIVVYGVCAVHRDAALWDDPLTFDPDRFGPGKSQGRDRWQYIPFGGGPRSCIGDHFAMLEATLALATVIRRTEIDSLEADFPLAVPMTTVAAAPIPARVKARSHAADPKDHRESPSRSDHESTA